MSVNTRSESEMQGNRPAEMDDALNTPAFKAFEQKIQEMGLFGQWMADGLLESARGGPKPAGVPYIWRWPEIQSVLAESCEVMTDSFTARRAIGKSNPALKMGATHTLAYSVQIVRPGEVAWAHRHTINALRFVIDGAEKAFSVVNGEPLIMETNDLVLTPGWNWHDHHNESNKDVIWLDVLDMGLSAMALNQTFYETLGDASQPLRPDPGDYVSERTGIVRPVWEVPTKQAYPLRYPWKVVEPQLMKMAEQEGSPYDGVVLEYVNPMTGGPAFPTMGCWVQMLRPGEETKAHRHTSSSIFYVVRGEGTTVAGDREIAWSSHDIFVLPNWMEHRHINRSRENEAILFSVNDIPTLLALGFYREAPENSLHVTPVKPIPADLYKADKLGDQGI